MKATTENRTSSALLILPFLFCFVLTGFVGCEEEVTGSDDNTVKDAVGLVVEESKEQYLIYEVGAEIPLAPVNLPEPFQQDSLSVIFSGTILLPPANVRMTAARIELTEIRRYEGE